MKNMNKLLRKEELLLKISFFSIIKYFKKLEKH